MTKRCSRCRDYLPTSEFYVNTSKEDGRQSYCKSCLKVSVNKSKELKLAKGSYYEAVKQRSSWSYLRTNR